ncbi:hypothetical protein F4561_006221 [Lipingzhangella halophila]|uniref:Uncharacterized protein n=1 Tax=Lipingzhangella halophila TaxID=1783352 RepID=A0A7W7RNM6_9ACTN|nr:hypothetical protein [Lipingzhangella halophila]MBB4935327.1 hypothetical protein [Lipingzhangella halophila]
MTGTDPAKPEEAIAAAADRYRNRGRWGADGSAGTPGPVHRTLTMLPESTC